jgi:peptidoglycan hydrolase-like protein with peptidoglycan-binding domain
MRKIVKAALAVVLACASAPAAVPQSGSNSNSVNSNANAGAKKRPPIFRATKDQIKQAQALLRQRGLYAGDATGKLDDASRAGLRKYQEAEGIKVTGTLNRVTLEKMSIALTDKQKAM